MDIKELVTTFEKSARFNLEKDSSLQPCFITLKDEQMGIAPLFFNTIEEKVQIKRNIQQLIKDIDPDIIAFISDAWVTEVSHNDPEELDVLPSLSPLRQEAIIISVKNRRNGETVTSSTKHMATDDGTIIWGPMEFLSGDYYAVNTWIDGE